MEHKLVQVEKELVRHKAEHDKILEKMDKIRKNLTIKCESCHELHKIRDLELIQTYWYVSPYGCTGGDYWNSGEVQFICPIKNIRNRLLFNNYDVPWEKRGDYDYSPHKQFVRNYKHLFKSVMDTYDDEPTTEFTNNYYVDKNRKKFGLVDKIEPQH